MVVEEQSSHRQDFTVERRSAPKQLVFFSLEDWNEVWRRNQFVCAALHDRHPDLSILWICPPVDISYSIRRGKLEELSQIRLTPKAVAELPRIKIVKPLKLLPNIIGRGVNRALMLSTVSNIVHSLGWSQYTAWVNDQSARHYLPGKRDAAFVVYDITDDWIAMPQAERVRRQVAADDTYMLQHADCVIVCSKELYQRKNGSCQSLNLIPNGVDNQRYHPDKLAQLTIPQELRQIPKPIVGYTGTLHSARLDVALMVALAGLLPQVSFAFVGPNCLTDSESSLLESRPNCHILGQRSYAQLPSYIASFDACMTPHLVDAFTESLDPLKLYEYMSTGKPIVSTPCAGFREFPQLIKLATTAEQFARAIEEALAGVSGPAELESARLRWAESQSWTERVSQIEELLGWK